MPAVTAEKGAQADLAVRIDRPMSPAEMIAGIFHATYETLAPEHGYEAREASAVAREDVPAKDKALMIATVQNMLDIGAIRPGPLGTPRPPGATN